MYASLDNRVHASKDNDGRSAALRILLLSDGRPGHFHLSEGVVAAIARKRPVATTRLDIRKGLVPTRILARLYRMGLPLRHLLRLGYGLSSSVLGPADLVVSAGGDTLAANVAVARLTGAANIFCGSLRHFPPEAFSLVITSYARHADRLHHLVTLKPSPFDPDSGGQASAAHAEEGRSLPPVRAGLLIGGDAGTIRYRQSDWDLLFAFLDGTWTRHGTSWIVATSPRTPDHLADRLQVVAESDSGPIERLIDYRDAGPGGTGPLLKSAAAVLVTGDSSSMISEAIGFRRPVVAVFPADSRLPTAEEEYRRFLVDSGWLRSLALAEISPETWLSALEDITPLTANPLDVLYAALHSRRPELFGDCRSSAE